MSDIRKLLDTINEMATVSGSVASVAQPMGGVERRKKDSIFYEGSKCTTCGCEPCKCETSEGNTVDGTKTPPAPKVSEFGLWKNSALIGQEQRDKKKSKKAVKESKKEYNALDDVQDEIKRMARRHKEETADWSVEKSRALNKKLANRAVPKAKLDELGNSLMPGGQRKLKLAERDVDENIVDTARDAVKGAKRFMKSKPSVRNAIISHDSKARGAESKRDVFRVMNQNDMANTMNQQAEKEHKRADRIANKFAAESKRTKK